MSKKNIKSANSNNNNNNKGYKFLVIGIILLIVYKLLDNIDYIFSFLDKICGILFPLFLGIGIAFFLYNPIKKLERHISNSKINFIKKRSLNISITIVYLSIALLITFFILFISPELKENLNDFFNNIPIYYNRLLEFIENNKYLNNYGGNKNLIENIINTVIKSFDFKNINKYITIITNIASSFLSLFIGIVISIYLICEKENIMNFCSLLFNKVFPEKIKKPVKKYFAKGIDLFYSYFSGLALDSLIIGIISMIVLTLFKVKYAVLLGFVIFIGNMIPFFGPIVAAIIVYLISCLSIGPMQALWTLLFQFVLGQIDGNLIQPKVVSLSTGISPLLILIAVLIFGDLFGVVGIFVGVPICALIKMIIIDYLTDNLDS